MLLVQTALCLEADCDAPLQTVMDQFFDPHQNLTAFTPTQTNSKTGNYTRICFYVSSVNKVSICLQRKSIHLSKQIFFFAISPSLPRCQLLPEVLNIYISIQSDRGPWWTDSLKSALTLLLNAFRELFCEALQHTVVLL